MEDQEEDTQSKKPLGLLSLPRKSRFTSSSIFRRRQKVKAPATPRAVPEGQYSSPTLAGYGLSAAAFDKPDPNESLEKPPGASLQGSDVTHDSGSSSQLSTEVHVDETRLSAPLSHQYAPKPEDATSARSSSIPEFQCVLDDSNHAQDNVTLLPPTLPVTSSRRPHHNAHVWSDILRMDPNNPSNTPNLPDLLTSLSSHADASRKMAAFKLQTLINDPSFAEHFVHAGGLLPLRTLILETSGNTLAYSLSSFARLLEVDQGWEAVDKQVVEKVSRARDLGQDTYLHQLQSVELVVCQPLVNILRGAMAILVSIVSRPYHADRTSQINTKQNAGGFQALKPAIAVYPQFLEMLVTRLSSADHALCANALQLINSLMRDAITNDNETEWPKFIKRIQDLGVIKAVYVLMQSSALQDLAHPLLEFQALTKILLRRWKDVPVDLVKPEHRRTIKAVHLSSNPEKPMDNEPRNGEPKPKHNPQKWRRLGFTTENPEPDFVEMGFLGMMDLSDYVRKHQDEFQNILLEQAVAPEQKRCPLARASLTLTAILFEHFEVEKMDLEDSKSYLALESRTNWDKVFKPLLLHWSRLHVAGLHAFFRLWKATGAEADDFFKIIELVRILVESVVGGAERTKGIEEIEKEMAAFEYKKLRELQMELLDLTYEDVWGQHLRGAKEELQIEALQFVKEQRIRCLLAGTWFPHGTYTDQEAGGPVTEDSLTQNTSHGYRFIRLAENRKYLHWADYEYKEEQTPNISALREKIDLSIVSSVVSNVTANDRSSLGSDSTLKELPHDRFTTNKITIHGYLPKSRGDKDGHARTSSKTSSARSASKESVLLTFHPNSHHVASEWLDGLLMLLEQQPITAETNKLIHMISDYGLKVRLLNVRFNDEEGIVEGMDGIDGPEIPSREGLDDDYYYEI
jgi:engulfment and cell motility protein 1